MELLTFIGQAARRKDEYIDRAERLAGSNPSLEKLEEEMDSRAVALTKKLRADKITFPEFQRASAEDTLVGSLASYIIGSESPDITPVTFSSAMDQMKYLWAFFEDIQRSLANGRLEEDTSDFQEDVLYDDDDEFYYPYPGDEEVPVEGTSSDKAVVSATSAAGIASKPQSLAIPTGVSSPQAAAVRAAASSADEVASQQRSTSVDATLPTEKMTELAGKSAKPRATPTGPATWQGVLSRLKRFLVTPLYRWFKTGEFTTKQQTGFSEMRRISRGDKRVCQDCRYYASLGWVPMGSLPMPGLQCQCHDRCRCRVVYR